MLNGFHSEASDSACMVARQRPARKWQWRTRQLPVSRCTAIHSATGRPAATAGSGTNGEGGTAWTPPSRTIAIIDAYRRQRRSTVFHLVQCQIQLQHVHARFTENAELAAARITIDQ